MECTSHGSPVDYFYYVEQNTSSPCNLSKLFIFSAFVEFLKPDVVLAGEAPPLLILVKRVPRVQLCSFLQHQSTHFKLQTNYSLQSTDYRQTIKELSKNYPRKLTLRNQSKCIIHRNDSFFCWLTYKQYFKCKTTLCVFSLDKLLII